jgi:hypothetical protein
MAISKKTKSGKGLMFIDDEGNVYMQSEMYVRKQLDGDVEILMWTRMPEKVAVGRFAPSPVLNRETGEKEPVTRSNDAFSEKRAAERADQKAYEDKW